MAGLVSEDVSSLHPLGPAQLYHIWKGDNSAYKSLRSRTVLNLCFARPTSSLGSDLCIMHEAGVWELKGSGMLSLIRNGLATGLLAKFAFAACYCDCEFLLIHECSLTTFIFPNLCELGIEVQRKFTFGCEV